MRERHGGASGVDGALELARAAGAADEVDALVGADVADPEHRLEQALLQHAHVERRDDVAAASGAPPSRSVCQRPARYIADLAFAGRRCGPGARRRTARRPLRGTDRARGRPGPSRPVVREDLRLVVRERDGEKRVGFASPTLLRAPRERARGAVMSVGDVQERDARERLLRSPPRHPHRRPPDRVAHARPALRSRRAAHAARPAPTAHRHRGRRDT